MKGYKGFNKYKVCDDCTDYKIGDVFEIDDLPIVGIRGFHFCDSLRNTFRYHDPRNGSIICEIEALGDIDTKDNIIFSTNRIRIVREVIGNGQSANKGHGNSGFCSTGDQNSGDFNIGDYNTGNCNYGDHNSGNYNTGSFNTGYHNLGNCNYGSYNLGDYNYGYCNNGESNRGDHNCGDKNLGNGNFGDFNSGDYNIGVMNTGSHNYGNFNSGDWNAWNGNSGCFCTTYNGIKFFDKDSDWTYEDWCKSKAREILSKCPTQKIKIHWKPVNFMTDIEKKSHPECETTFGYLKREPYNITMNEEMEDVRQEWWDGLLEEDKNTIKCLPNFDAKKFYECTGIRV